MTFYSWSLLLETLQNVWFVYALSSFQRSFVSFLPSKAKLDYTRQADYVNQLSNFLWKIFSLRQELLVCARESIWFCPTTQPTLSAITTAANELEAAHGETQTARQTAVTKTSIMHEKEAALEARLTTRWLHRKRRRRR
jgi:hypothetical protein